MFFVPYPALGTDFYRYLNRFQITVFNMIRKTAPVIPDRLQINIDALILED